jgi:hypothetical protein
MVRKLKLNRISVITLLIATLAIVVVLLFGPPLKILISKILILAIYGVVFLVYSLRIALIAIGLFALYRILWERVNGRSLKEMEVEIG